MRIPINVLRWLHRQGVSRPKLRGGWLHRRLGDDLLHPNLWTINRDGIALAWLIGFPISWIPFLPMQSVFATLAGFRFHANILLAIALQFIISNPATAIIQLPACYISGVLVLGGDVGAEWNRLWSEGLGFFAWEKLGGIALALYLGSFVSGIIVGILGYLWIRFTFPATPAAKHPVAGALRHH